MTKKVAKKVAKKAKPRSRRRRRWLAREFDGGWYDFFYSENAPVVRGEGEERKWDGLGFVESFCATIFHEHCTVRLPPGGGPIEMPKWGEVEP